MLISVQHCMTVCCKGEWICSDLVGLGGECDFSSVRALGKKQFFSITVQKQLF